jgi:hypothetical protein
VNATACVRISDHLSSLLSSRWTEAIHSVTNRTHPVAKSRHPRFERSEHSTSLDATRMFAIFPHLSHRPMRGCMGKRTEPLRRRAGRARSRWAA